MTQRIPDADHAWAMVQDIARRKLRADEPIYTLNNRVANWVVSVEDERVKRISARQRYAGSGEPNNAITKKVITAIWEQMIKTGSSLDAGGPFMKFALAYAFIAEIPGVQHRGGFDIFIANPNAVRAAFDSLSQLH